MTLTNILIYNLNFKIKNLKTKTNFLTKKNYPYFFLLNIHKLKTNLQKYNSERCVLTLTKYSIVRTINYLHKM